MGILLIRCPHTGRPISTGVQVDPHPFAARPNTLSYLRCPDCGLDHAWWTREARLEEAVEVSPPKTRFSVGEEEAPMHRDDADASHAIWLNGYEDFRNREFVESVARELHAIRKFVASVSRGASSIQRSRAHIAESRALLDGDADAEGRPRERDGAE
jgi:hypothetical protein